MTPQSKETLSALEVDLIEEDEMETPKNTHTFKFHLYQVKYDFAEKPHWCLNDSPTLGKGDPEWLYIGPREVVVEVPEFQDMRGYQIEALREQEQKLRAEFTKRITDIQARIQSLQALEMSA